MEVKSLGPEVKQLLAYKCCTKRQTLVFGTEPVKRVFWDFLVEHHQRHVIPIKTALPPAPLSL